MLKKTIVATLLALSLPVLASEYYVVVPAPGHVAGKPLPDISVALNPVALPAAFVGEAYAGFDFNTVLQVTGDPNFQGQQVTWSVVSGSLPAGLSLSPGGALRGTPSDAGTASFTVRANYRTKSGQNEYQVVVGNISVALDASALPNAAVGSTYSFDFSPRLTVSGDPSYDAAKVTWSTVGTVPAGITLSPMGLLTAMPAQLGDQGATFSVNAAYRTKSDQQTYTLYPSDPLYGNVTLLMHMDGANGSTSFVDAKGHAFSKTGSPSISTVSSQYGGASLRLPGGAALKAAYSSAWVMPGDFTVEFWANIAAHDNFGGLIAAAATNSWAGWQLIFDSATGNLRFEGGPSTSQVALVASSSYPYNAWTHVALTRRGSTIRLFQNGALVGSTTCSGTLDDVGNTFNIGVERTGGAYVTGYIDDLRITQGVARYTANFTPPPASLPTR